MPSSLCPACGDHAINLIDHKCGSCGNSFDGIPRSEMELLRAMLSEMGPLRDALTIEVAQNVSEYATGCVCGEGNKVPRPARPKHKKDCPASTHGVRFIEHLYRRKKEREERAAIEESEQKQAALLERAFGRQEDVEFIADLREKLHLDPACEPEAPVISTSEDIRTECPECGGALAIDGEHAECKPCGLRLFWDVTGAQVPGSREVEVWHCPSCDQCYTFQRLDLFPYAVILAGDEIPPVNCFGCGGRLEQWTTFRPFPRTSEILLSGHGPVELVRSKLEVKTELHDQHGKKVAEVGSLNLGAFSVDEDPPE